MHKPVLFEEVMELLNLREGGVYIDGTMGSGGHAEGILERIGANGMLLAIDRDQEALDRTGSRLSRFGDRCIRVHGNYADMASLAAEAGVTRAQEAITQLTIHAPFAGLLETDTAELGSLMQPGTPCATIIQLNEIKLVGFVPEADVAKINVGAIAGARLTSGQEARGRVTFLSRSADPLTRTFRVEVTVANADLSISDGQTAEILVAADGRTAHLIDQSSLTLDDDGVLGVRTVGEGNIATFMPVTLLRDTAEGVWVTDLPETVDIITVGQEFVIDGVHVAPTYQEAKG